MNTMSIARACFAVTILLAACSDNGGERLPPKNPATSSSSSSTGGGDGGAGATGGIGGQGGEAPCDPYAPGSACCIPSPLCPEGSLGACLVMPQLCSQGIGTCETQACCQGVPQPIPGTHCGDSGTCDNGECVEPAVGGAGGG